MFPLLHQRRANTLIELIVYMALTLIIIVGLTNIVSRLRQAERSGVVKTDVQQSVRSAIQQFTALAQLYESGAIMSPEGEPLYGEAGSDIRLWNAAQNQNLPPGEPPRTYMRFWLSDGVLFTQEYRNDAPSLSAVAVTPENIIVSTLEFRDVSGQNGDAVISIRIVAEDNSPSENLRDQFTWEIRSAVTLRPKNELAGFCCPSYLSFCPTGFPVCENSGCFADNQAASDVFGQFETVNGIGVPDFESGDKNNGQNLTANAGGFDGPRGVEIDELNGRLFVADTSNSRVLEFAVADDGAVQQYNASGVFGQPNFTTTALSPTSATSIGFSGVNGIAYNTHTNHLFVADSNTNRIVGYDLDQQGVARRTADIVIGQPNFSSGGNGTSPTSFSQPTDIVFDYANKYAFVADSSNNRVLGFRLTDDYAFESAIGDEADIVFGQDSFTDNSSSHLHLPQGVAVSDTHLFVTSFNGNKVVAYDLTSIGTKTEIDSAGFVVTSQTHPHVPSRVNSPTGIAFDSGNDRLLVSDASRVLSFPADTDSLKNPTNNNAMEALNVFGQSGEPAPSASSLSAPTEIAFDSLNQRLFVSDTGAHRVVVFAGGAAACSGAEFFEPPTGGSTSAASSAAPEEPIHVQQCDADPPCQEQEWDPAACDLHKSIDDEFIEGSSTFTTDISDYIRACSAVEDKAGEFELTNTPSDFDAATRVTVRASYRLNETESEGTNTSGFFISLVDSSSEPLTSSTMVSSIHDTDWRYWQTELPIIGSANTKSTWDAARLDLESISQGSFASVKISAIEVVLEYDNGNKTTTLRPNGVVLGNTWARVGDPPPFDAGIFSDLKLWLIAGSGAMSGGNPAQNGNAVDTWLDQKKTGEKYPASQSVATKRPTYIANGQNGLPVIRFDGSNDVLFTHQMTGAYVNGYTYFYVMKFASLSVTGTQRPFGARYGSSPTLSFFDTFRSAYNSIGQATRHSTAISTNFPGGGGSLVTTDLFGGTATYDSPSDRFVLALWKHGVKKLFSQTITPANWQLIGNNPDTFRHAIGSDSHVSNSYDAMDVSEIIIYGRGLSDGERCTVEAYLSAKYNLGIPPCS